MGVSRRCQRRSAMTTTSNPDTNGAPTVPLSAALEELLRAAGACSRDEKRLLVDRLLRDLIGDKPDQEYGLYNADGSSYLFLVPPRIHVQYQLTPERVAE